MKTNLEMNKQLSEQNILVVTIQFEYRGSIEEEQTYLFNRHQLTVSIVTALHQEYEEWFINHEDGTDVTFVEWVREKGFDCELLQQSSITYGIRGNNPFIETFEMTHY